ncbi:hypothetical protein CLV65_0365 [Pseudoscardovia suis]|uniref:Uncharacterized protein n=1 Tax=Pseudoscardovia suis TaxID=987063 RepID=A0A261ERP5_9BIFI|nr:hypothetical protein PSSU_1361 [Pseudoscardovia suis]PJJ69657.1 hypothetical protein CLV65_0365 [Pseudoscardovia suis]
MVRGTALRTVWLPTRLQRCLFHKEFLDQKSHWEDGTVPTSTGVSPRRAG